MSNSFPFHRTPARLLTAFLLLASLAGCRGMTSEKPPIHLNPNMDSQNKYLPLRPSEHFYNGAVMQHPVQGTLARGDLRQDEVFYTGRSFWAGWASNPLEVDEPVKARGRERFEIYCRPCHGSQGDGQSVMVERTGISTADLHEERIRNLSDGEIFSVISKGKGLMPAYDYLIEPRDRWAIVAHIRELQKGQR